MKLRKRKKGEKLTNKETNKETNKKPRSNEPRRLVFNTQLTGTIIFIDEQTISQTKNLILSYLSRSLADRWGNTVDFITSFLHSSLLMAFSSMIFHSRPVHSLMLSSHRFPCLSLRLPPCTVPRRTVLASPDDRV